MMRLLRRIAGALWQAIKIIIIAAAIVAAIWRLVVPGDGNSPACASRYFDDC